MISKRITTSFFGRGGTIFLGSNTIASVARDGRRVVCARIHELEIERIVCRYRFYTRPSIFLSFPFIEVISKNHKKISINLSALGYDDRISVIQWLYERASTADKTDMYEFFGTCPTFIDLPDTSINRRKYLLIMRIFVLCYFSILFIHSYLIEMVLLMAPFNGFPRQESVFKIFIYNPYIPLLLFAILSLLVVLLKKNYYWGNRLTDRYYKDHNLCTIQRFWGRLLLLMCILTTFPLFFTTCATLFTSSDADQLSTMACKIFLLLSEIAFLLSIYAFLFPILRLFFIFTSVVFSPVLVQHVLGSRNCSSNPILA